ncbi:MAG: glycosyltransferase family 2 protein [Leptolyngbya sp. SIO4C1]|nr:glycosyltransferase family 2 protein [Leptolyngbya sp. SIO4C1]
MSTRRYILISPCRNEAAYIQTTIDAIAKQSVLPAKWIIVDDGSTDETPKIIAAAASQYPFIEIIRRDNRGERSVGPGVIEAFYAGYSTIDPSDYDYVCKLDVDLDIPATYFEQLMQRMETNPRLGTCSGKPYFLGKDGKLVSERCGDETSVGMIKFYRTACFEQIGGFVRQVMWDGIDCHRCRMKGWIACSWDDPDLRFTHLRPMGSSHKSISTGRLRHGSGQYFMGTGPLYMLASAVYRMMAPPLVVGGVMMLAGYLKSMLTRQTRYDDLEFRQFLRRYQWQCLIKGKRQATADLNEHQAKNWSLQGYRLGTLSSECCQKL